MPITEILEENCRKYGNDICLVEINPEIKETKPVSWKEYGLIEESGKSDAPGRPMTFKVTNNFLKMFGISSLDELPNLPKYKLDENEQIVIDEIVPKEEKKEEESPVENNNN